jgi:myo-inositol-1(or 4)-monophosphatase
LKQGFPELGVIYFPCLDELYTASCGTGAYFNGKRLHVQPPNPSQPWSFFSCCSRTFRDYEVSIKYKPRILGSAAYSCCCVARGISLLSFEATPKLWDFAAAWLIVEEAGGFVATLDGSQPFPPEGVKDHSQVNYPILAAATFELLEKGRKHIRKRA